MHATKSSSWKTNSREFNLLWFPKTHTTKDLTHYCSIENLQAFVGELDEGSLEAYVKSQPIPESNDGPVTIAVGKNFDEVVMNNGKDTLVEFYAEWCGHVSVKNIVHECHFLMF